MHHVILPWRTTSSCTFDFSAWHERHTMHGVSRLLIPSPTAPIQAVTSRFAAPKKQHPIAMSFWKQVGSGVPEICYRSYSFFELFLSTVIPTFQMLFPCTARSMICPSLFIFISPLFDLSIQAEVEVVHGANMQGTNQKKKKKSMIILREERP